MNQDSLILVEDIGTGSVLMACLDGHGVKGEILSNVSIFLFFSVKLINHLLRTMDIFLQHFKMGIENKLFVHPEFLEDPRSAILQTLKSTEFELYNKQARLGDYSGTTLTMVLVRGNKALVTNIGDSRTILAKKTGKAKWEAVQITTDHKPDAVTEYNRIRKAGGRVFAVQYDDGTIGPPRVWLATVNTPGLAMSRSLGDFIAHTAGVCSKPDFYEFEIDEDEDCALISATDGVWDVMSNEEIVAMVQANTEANAAVDAILAEARKRWLKKEKVVDDATISIMRLNAADC